MLRGTDGLLDDEQCGDGASVQRVVLITVLFTGTGSILFVLSFCVTHPALL